MILPLNFTQPLYTSHPCRRVAEVGTVTVTTATHMRGVIDEGDK